MMWTWNGLGDLIAPELVASKEGLALLTGGKMWRR